MSIAKFDPKLLIVTWGPFLLNGFESGTAVTATLYQPERYTRKSSRGRAIHTQVTDNGGSVTMRFQADSPTLPLLAAQMIIDLAPGGNVVFPLIVKDLNGLDSIVSPAARLVTIPVLEHNDGEQGPREYMWWCEPLVIFHGGIASING